MGPSLSDSSSVDPREYFASLAQQKEAKPSVVQVDFAKGPLVIIREYESDELYQDEIVSLETIHQKHMDAEKQYLLNLNRFVKQSGIKRDLFQICCSSMMRISW